MAITPTRTESKGSAALRCRRAGCRLLVENRGNDGRGGMLDAIERCCQRALVSGIELNVITRGCVRVEADSLGNNEGDEG